MKTLLLVGILLLSGCAKIVLNSDIVELQKACESHGGTISIVSYFSSTSSSTIRTVAAECSDHEIVHLGKSK